MGRNCLEKWLESRKWKRCGNFGGNREAVVSGCGSCDFGALVVTKGESGLPRVTGWPKGPHWEYTDPFGKEWECDRKGNIYEKGVEWW